VSDASFAVSTFLFHQSRLDREHLVEIAAHGFDAVELFALRSHFDYADPLAVEQLAEWLDDTRLELTALHAPTAESASGGTWSGGMSVAAADARARERAVAEVLKTINLAKALPYSWAEQEQGIGISSSASTQAPTSLNAPSIAHVRFCEPVSVQLKRSRARRSLPCSSVEKRCIAPRHWRIAIGPLEQHARQSGGAGALDEENKPGGTRQAIERHCGRADRHRAEGRTRRHDGSATDRCPQRRDGVLPARHDRRADFRGAARSESQAE